MIRRHIFTAVILAMAICLNSCSHSPRRLGIDYIVAVLPQHATRVIVVYRDKNGLMYDESLHQSNTETDGKIIVNPQDYLSLYGGKKDYGPMPGYEVEYQEYLKTKHTY